MKSSARSAPAGSTPTCTPRRSGPGKSAANSEAATAVITTAIDNNTESGARAQVRARHDYYREFCWAAVRGDVTEGGMLLALRSILRTGFFSAAGNALAAAVERHRPAAQGDVRGDLGRPHEGFGAGARNHLAALGRHLVRVGRD